MKKVLILMVCILSLLFCVNVYAKTTEVNISVKDTIQLVKDNIKNENEEYRLVVMGNGYDNVYKDILPDWKIETDKVNTDKEDMRTVYVIDKDKDVEKQILNYIYYSFKFNGADVSQIGVLRVDEKDMYNTDYNKSIENYYNELEDVLETVKNVTVEVIKDEENKESKEITTIEFKENYKKEPSAKYRVKRK